MYHARPMERPEPPPQAREFAVAEHASPRRRPPPGDCAGAIPLPRPLRDSVAPRDRARLCAGGPLLETRRDPARAGPRDRGRRRLRQGGQLPEPRGSAPHLRRRQRAGTPASGPLRVVLQHRLRGRDRPRDQCCAGRTLRAPDILALGRWMRRAPAHREGAPPERVYYPTASTPSITGTSAAPSSPRGRWSIRARCCFRIRRGSRG
jgi:hypothetical protein